MTNPDAKKIAEWKALAESLRSHLLVSGDKRFAASDAIFLLIAEVERLSAPPPSDQTAGLTAEPLKDSLVDRLRQAAPMVRPRAVGGILPAWISEVIDQAADMLARTRPAPSPASPAWQDISSSPKDGTRVMLWIPSLTPSTIQAEWREDGREWVDVWNNDPIENARGRAEPTHWMLLPPPPSVQEGG